MEIFHPEASRQFRSFFQDPQFSFPVLRDWMTRGLLAHHVRDAGQFRRCLCGRGHLPRLHPLQRHAVLRLGAGEQEAPAACFSHHPDQGKSIPNILSLDLRVHSSPDAFPGPGKMNAYLRRRNPRLRKSADLIHIDVYAMQPLMDREKPEPLRRRAYRRPHLASCREKRPGRLRPEKTGSPGN